MTTRPPTVFQILAESEARVEAITDPLIPPPQFEERIAKLETDEREFVAKFAANSIQTLLMFQSPQGRVRAWENALAENRKLKAEQAENQQAEQAPASQESTGAPKSGAPVAVVTRISEVARRPIEWLWRDRIPLGMLTLLEGDPGCGKSTILLDLAARITRGLPMPDGSGGGSPRTVVLLSAEDDPGAVIRPRLEAAGAVLDRVITLKMQTDKETREPVISGEDVAEWERVIREEGAALLIVDPLVAYLQDGVDTNSDHSIRRALIKLKPLAELTGCAVVAVRHWKKAATDKALYRGGGSIGFIGAARSGLVVGYDPDDETQRTRIFAVSKTNLAPIAPSLAFVLEVPPGADMPRVEWLGVSAHSANALTAEPPPRKDTADMDEAQAFLRSYLAGGPVPSKDVKREAKERDISEATLRRAKKKLGVVAEKDGYGSDGRWQWRLDAAPTAYAGGEA